MSDQPEPITTVDWIIQSRGLPDGPYRGNSTWREDGAPGSSSRAYAEEIADLYRRQLPGYEYRIAKRTTTIEIEPAPADGHVESETVPVHACPEPGDNGVMPCCRRPPFEVRGERLTRDPDLVTCRALPVDQLADGEPDHA